MRTEGRKSALYGILPGKLVSPPEHSLVGDAKHAHFTLFPGETSFVLLFLRATIFCFMLDREAWSSSPASLSLRQLFFLDHRAHPRSHCLDSLPLLS